MRLSRIPFRHFGLHLIKLGAEAQNRTGDTRIFSPLLYRLSYLGARVIVASGSMSVKKVSMAMPYGEEVALAAVKFVEESGIEVLSKKWLAQSPSTVPRETVYNLALEVDDPGSEAMFLPCVGWHTIEVIEKLEWALQKPVISSNQATMWNLLRLANINDKIEGYGQLLSKY